MSQVQSSITKSPNRNVNCPASAMPPNMIRIFSGSRISLNFFAYLPPPPFQRLVLKIFIEHRAEPFDRVAPASHKRVDRRAGCCRPQLDIDPSRRYLRESFSRCLVPYSGRSQQVLMPVSSSMSSAFPNWEMGRLPAIICEHDFHGVIFEAVDIPLRSTL